MKRPNPNTHDYWTPARRKKHSERLEAFYDLQLQTPGWEKYVAATSGRWTQKMCEKQAAITRSVWRSRTREARRKHSLKISLYHVTRQIEDARRSGGKIPYRLIEKRRELEHEIQTPA